MHTAKITNNVVYIIDGENFSLRKACKKLGIKRHSSFRSYYVHNNLLNNTETLLDYATKYHTPTHGLTDSKIYSCWASMKNRCVSPNHSSYKNYGGKGIKVCERWKNFENFYTDMGDPPFKRASLERINNLEGYNPDNVRWATYKEQARNKCSNVFLTWGNKTLCLADWAIFLSIDRGTTSRRLQKWGIVEKTFSTSLEKEIQTVTYKGIKQPVSKVCCSIGRHRSSYRKYCAYNKFIHSQETFDSWVGKQNQPVKALHYLTPLV